jgi:hypothetical protein
VAVCSVCGCGLVLVLVPFKNTGAGVDTRACEEFSPKLIALTTLLRVVVGDFPCDGERLDFGLEGDEGDLVREVCGLEGRDRVKVFEGLRGGLS